MADINEQAKVTLYVDGAAAGSQLDELRARAAALKTEMLKLDQANNLGGFKKAEKEYKSVTSQMRQLERQTVDVGKVMKNLSGSSLKDLEKVYRKLNQELKNLSANTKEFADKSKQLQRVASQMQTVRTSMAGTTKEGGILGGVMGKLGPAMIAAFAVGAVVKLGKAMVEVRQKFEKYEAVLKNSLGSQEKARREMAMLQEFATKTPFQLDELTGAFVKLVNQGFKPSEKQMTNLGDLAASTGKGFDQLAEALIDAQVGEFERLKEFGIRAQKEGDRVKFTFKGVTTEVDYTNEAIQKYVLSLGEVQGVQGSMAEISKTLGGRISNLKDAWDGLLNAMGSRTSGIFGAVIGWLTKFVDWAKVAFYSIKQIKDMALDKTTRENLKSALDEITTMQQSLAKNGMSLAAAQERATKLYYNSVDTTLKGYQDQLQTASEDEKENLNRKIEILKSERDAVEDHFKTLESIEKTKNVQVSKQDQQTAKRRSEAIKDLRQQTQDAWVNFWYDVNKELDPIEKEMFEKWESDIQTGLDEIDNNIKPPDLTGEQKQQLLEAEYALENSYEGQRLMFKRMLEDNLISQTEYNDKIAALDKELAQKKIESTERWADASKDLIETVSMFFEAAKNRELQAAGDNEKKKEEIEKKYARRQKAMAITQAVIEGIVEIARINSNAGVNADLTQTMRAILTAMAVARTAANVAIIASQKFSTGGYTGPGGKNEPAGIVHRGEYVIPQEAFSNPSIRSLVDRIEMGRLAGNLARMNVMPAPSFAAGGPVGTPMQVQTIIQQDPELKVLLKALNDQLARGIKAPVVYTDIEKAQNELARIRSRVNMT